MPIHVFICLLMGLSVAEGTFIHAEAICNPPCGYNEECSLIGRIPKCVLTPPSTTPYYTQDCLPPFPKCDFGLSCRRKSDGTQDCYPYCIPACSEHQACFWTGAGTLPFCKSLDPPACILPCPLGQYCQLDQNWNQYCAVVPTTTLPPCVLPCPLGQTCQYDQYGKPYCAAPPCNYPTPDPPAKTTGKPPTCNPPCKKGFRCQDDSGIPRCFPDSCPRHEVVNHCGSLCENKCASLCEPQRCPKICNPPACACDKDFYRNAAGRCVTEEKCPKCPTTPAPTKKPIYTYP